MWGSRRNLLIVGGVAVAHAGLFAMLAPGVAARHADVDDTSPAILVGFVDLPGHVVDAAPLLQPPVVNVIPPAVLESRSASAMDSLELDLRPVVAPETIDLAALDLPAEETSSLDLSDAPSERPPLPAAAVAAAQACEITGALQQSLPQSESVQLAIAQIPRTARSVADAVMLWDGVWRDGDALGRDTAVSPIRYAVLDALAHASANCLARDVQGPRFIAITMGASTTVLTLGSGIWRWGDLIGPTGASPIPPSATNVHR